MKGIGTDIIEITRIKKACENHAFVKRCFSEREIALLESRGMRMETIAGSFAAKEAFSKALGTGIRGFSLTDVEIERTSLGQPYIVFKGSPYKGCHLSISHCKNYATAVVVIE